MLWFPELKPNAVFKVLKSCRRHQWYLNGQTVILALSDPGLAAEEKQKLAKTLFRTPRLAISTGKPEFPDVSWECEAEKRPELHTLVTHNSWLVFDLLQLQGQQVDIGSIT